jgi:hypothetical protein
MTSGRVHFALASASLVLCAGCAGPDSTPDEPAFEYPMDDELRVHHLQVKGTHNSYHVDTLDGSVVDWAYTHAPLAEQAACQGVRQFELDVSWQDDGSFAVFHVPMLDEGTTCPTFRDCLGALRGWSDANPAHHPLFVMIEPKDPFDADTVEVYFQELEAAIEDAWPRERILTPDAVMGDHGSLRDALAAEGWPTLGESRGKILLWLLEIGDYRDAYTHGGSSLDGRLMFVKSDVDHAFGAILIRDDPVGEAGEIRAGVLDGFLVRTRADGGGGEPAAGDLSRFEAALASGATFISTDYAVPAAGMDYDITLPGGTPSVCNPVTAPAGCTSEALESPELMADGGCG